MSTRHLTAALFGALLLAGSAHAATVSGYGLAVVLDDAARPEYSARGNVYIEAVRGAAYGIRITNPTPYRVAVALSVDGLNTIDAKHTDPWNAAKWILDPYESTVISGWQVSDRSARRFYFTGERDSYGAAVGKTADLGVVEAVFYRERQREAVWQPSWRKDEQPVPPSAAEGARPQRAPATNAAPAAPSAKAAPQEGLSDDYAATGMGYRERHEVHSVSIDLEPQPVAKIRLRYEFRPQLVRLGVLPSITDPLERREQARGFSWCPEPR